MKDLSRVVSDLEAVREELTDTEGESRTSVNDWVIRVQAAARTAHTAARAGSPSEEYRAWLECAAAAVGRAQWVLAAWEGE